MNKQVVSLLFFAAPLGLPAGPGVPRSDARLSPDQAERSSMVVNVCNPEKQQADLTVVIRKSIEQCVL